MNKNTIKPEMTVEAKARFFAQYWGQKVWIVALNGDSFVQKVCASYMTKYSLKHRCLLLKPLSSITDEDAIEVALINGSPNYVDGQSPFGSKSSHMRVLAIQGKAIVKEMERFSCVNLFITDFLRSRNYALPFMGWSVEQMVEAGWIKLSEKGGSSNG